MQERAEGPRTGWAALWERPVPGEDDHEGDDHEEDDHAETWRNDRPVEDGFGVFVAAATGRATPTGARQPEDPDTGDAGTRRASTWTAALPRSWRDVPTGGVLAVLLVVAVVLGGTLVVAAGVGGPGEDPALPVAGADEVVGDAAATAPSDPADGSGVERTPEGGAAAAESLVVHVAGAVVAPGVHRLAPGARVHEAIAAAGGPVAGADLDRLNLAAPLSDGAQVHVPLQGAPGGGAAGVGPGSAAGQGAGGGAAGGPVSLSTADASALDALPGVGPSTAAAIIAHREANGPFGSIEELLEVRGIGEAKLDGLRDLVVP